MTTKGSPTASAAAPKKTLGRVAVVGLGPEATGVLAECFRQFAIQTVAISDDPVERLQREKFEACVLRLDDDAARVLEAARKSPSNSRIVVYGVCNTAQEALKYSRFCVNAVLGSPVERQNALRVVRATHLLVAHEFRRYVRIPIVSEVRVKSDTGEFRGTTVEVSGGGMSLTAANSLPTGTAVSVSFELPRLAQVNLRGAVCWVKPGESQIGVRFDSADEARFFVRKWIDEFIENS
jgi:hypothetical protein